MSPIKRVVLDRANKDIERQKELPIDGDILDTRKTQMNLRFTADEFPDPNFAFRK